MKIAYLLLVFLHGLIHILGFLKGFGFKEVKALTLPISQTMGLLWLAAAILFVLYGVLYITDAKYAWLIGLLAVVISQILIIIFWKDAKFGSLPNAIILVVSLISYGHYNFQKLVRFETENVINQSEISTEKIISENDIKDLPIAVKKWLRRSGAVGEPYIYIGKVVQQAKMKLKPEQDNWYNARAVQYTTLDVPACIWPVDVEMNKLLSFQGRDKFIEGSGEMLIKLNALFNVVKEKGEKLSEGTLQRYLGEMVWFPSLALSPYISWQAINDSTARAVMAYKGTKGAGTFYFNGEGDFIKFSAMRYKDTSPDAKRYEWVLLVEEHTTFEGIKVPSKMTASWKLEDEDWTWLKLEISDLKYNEQAVQ